MSTSHIPRPSIFRVDRRPRSVPSLLSSPCRRCALTWTAAELLERVANDLERSRGDDGSWFAERCAVCDRVTAVVDEKDGSVFGDVDASASLGDVIELWPRLDDVDAVPRVAPQPDRRRDRRLPRRERSRGWLTLPVAGLVVLVVAAAAFAAIFAIARSQRVSTPVANVARPSDGAPDATVEQTPPMASPIRGVVGPLPPGIAVGRVDAIRVANDVEAIARIRNASDRQVPPTGVTFEVVGPRGGVLATSTTTVDLAIGETKTVGVDALTLNATDRATGVRVSVADIPADAPASRVHVVVSDVALETIGDRIAMRGVVANIGDAHASVTVSCAVRQADDALTNVAVDQVEVAAYGVRAFSMWLPAEAPPSASAACGAS